MPILIHLYERVMLAGYHNSFLDRCQSAKSGAKDAKIMREGVNMFIVKSKAKSFFLQTWVGKQREGKQAEIIKISIFHQI